MFPDPSTPQAEQAVNVVNRRRPISGDFLTKYGKYNRLNQMIKHGRFRISPASSYDDPSLNPAIKDQGLDVFIQPHPSEFKMDVYDGKTKKPKGAIKPIEGIIRKTFNTDFYVYCLSHVFVPRLFLDFEADSCQLITKPKQFIEKILSSFKKLLPDWEGFDFSVNYYDPLNTTLEDKEPFVWKHFRYSYQKEYRLLWLSPKTTKEIDHVYLELGTLEDICEIISLENSD